MQMSATNSRKLKKRETLINIHTPERSTVDVSKELQSSQYYNSILLQEEVLKSHLRERESDQFQDFWLSSESFIPPSQSKISFQICDKGPIKFDTKDIGREYAEKSVALEIGEMRLQRIYDRRQQKKKFQYTEEMIMSMVEEGEKFDDQIYHGKESFNQCYNLVKDEIHRRGSFHFIDINTNSKDNSLRFEDNESNDGLLSPRTAALKESIRLNLIPLSLRDFFRISKPKFCCRVFSSDDICDDSVSLVDDDISISEDQIIAINIRDHSIGDSNGLCLASALIHCPCVQSINLAGNRLTDLSIYPILESLFRNNALTSINLSNNKLDSDSISILKKHVRGSECKLRELALGKADIDDEECADIMDAIAENRSIKKLILYGNKIGEMEEYNTVMPDFVTGGEAIAEVIENNSIIQYLDISWNNIRKDTAITLVQSIGSNQGLTYLDISHNNLGDKAGQLLAHSLRSNDTLEIINVSFNSFYPRSALIFANVLEKKCNIKTVHFQGNTVGPLASVAFLRSVRVAALQGRCLRIFFQNSNLHYQDSSTRLFDRSCPSGQYQLKCDDPYDYTIACILFELVNIKASASIDKVFHQESGRRDWDEVALAKFDKDRIVNIESPNLSIVTLQQFGDQVKELNRKVGVYIDLYNQQCDKQIVPCHDSVAHIVVNSNPKIGKYFTLSLKSERKQLKYEIIEAATMFRFSISNPVADLLLEIFLIAPLTLRETPLQFYSFIVQAAFSVAITLASPNEVLNFNSLDSEDKMSFQHFEAGLKHLGIISTYENSLRLFRSLDINQSGWLSQNDFYQCLRSFYEVDFPNRPYSLRNQYLRTPFVIPTTGILKLRYSQEVFPCCQEEMMTDTAIEIFADALDAVVPKTESRMNMLKYALVGDMVVSAHQAEYMFKKFRHMNESRIESLSLYLPQMATSLDACRLITKVLNFDEIMSLRSELGTSFGIYIGNPSGHYSISLDNEKERRAFNKLIEYNNFERIRRLAWAHHFRNMSSTNLPFDTFSRDLITFQESDFSESFRNFNYNGQFFQITMEFLQNPPTQGHLCFDFVSSRRPCVGQKAILSKKFERVLSLLFPSDTSQSTNTNEINKSSCYVSDMDVKNDSVDVEYDAQGVRVRKKPQRNVITTSRRILGGKSKVAKTLAVMDKIQALVDHEKKARKGREVSTSQVDVMFWNEYVETTWDNMKKCYSEFLFSRIRLAMAQNGASKSEISLDASNLNIHST